MKSRKIWRNVGKILRKFYIHFKRNLGWKSVENSQLTHFWYFRGIRRNRHRRQRISLLRSWFWDDCGDSQLLRIRAVLEPWSPRKTPTRSRASTPKIPKADSGEFKRINVHGYGHQRLTKNTIVKSAKYRVVTISKAQYPPRIYL